MRDRRWNLTGSKWVDNRLQSRLVNITQLLVRFITIFIIQKNSRVGKFLENSQFWLKYVIKKFVKG